MSLLHAFSLALLGLSLYLYLPLRAALEILPCWGNPVTFAGVFWAGFPDSW